MSIDQRIRDGLRLTNGELPQPDVAHALAAVTSRAGARPQHRRLVVALAAAAAVRRRRHCRDRRADARE